MNDKVKEAGATEATADAIKTAEAKAASDAKTAERTRLSAILALPEAKERQAQALVLATTTDLSVDQAKGILAAAPVVAAVAGDSKDNGFTKAMEREGGANVAAGAGTKVEDDKSPAAVLARIQGNYTAASGHKFPKS